MAQRLTATLSARGSPHRGRGLGPHTAHGPLPGAHRPLGAAWGVADSAGLVVLRLSKHLHTDLDRVMATSQFGDARIVCENDMLTAHVGIFGVSVRKPITR